jgi:hypothetical protein
MRPSFIFPSDQKWSYLEWFSALREGQAAALHHPGFRSGGECARSIQAGQPAGIQGARKNLDA